MVDNKNQENIAPRTRTNRVRKPEARNSKRFGTSSPITSSFRIRKNGLLEDSILPKLASKKTENESQVHDNSNAGYLSTIDQLDDKGEVLILTTPLEAELNRLKTLFIVIDRVLWISHGQDRYCETVLFSSLRKRVEEACQRRLELSVVQKILYIFPNAYKLTKVRLNSLPDYIIELTRAGLPGHIDLTSNRTLTFRSHLFEQHCTKYQLNPTSSTNIPLSSLPSAESVYSKPTQTKITVRASQLKKDASQVTSLSRDGTTIKLTQITDNTPIADRQRQLLDRIRSKQTAREENAKKSVSPEIQRRLSLLGNIPLIVDILIQWQSTNGRSSDATVPMSKIVHMIKGSMRVRAIAESEVKDTIIILSEIIPEWCNIYNIRESVFVNMKKLTENHVDKATINERIDIERAKHLHKSD
ncbi:hypothetical protein V1511DRAFT_490309 [Dipodascopsis uninucleata]